MLKFSHLAFLLFLSLFNYCCANTLHGVIISVADGDTVTLIDEAKKQYKIRLVGIDAPEKKQPFGQASKNNLSKLIYKKNVEVQWIKHDKYQRVLGKIILNNTDICLEQIKYGMAWHYKKYKNEQSLEDRYTYSKAEEVARNSHIGLWSDIAPIEPSKFRHK